MSAASAGSAGSHLASLRCAHNMTSDTATAVAKPEDRLMAAPPLLVLLLVLHARQLIGDGWAVSGTPSMRFRSQEEDFPRLTQLCIKQHTACRSGVSGDVDVGFGAPTYSAKNLLHSPRGRGCGRRRKTVRSLVRRLPDRTAAFCGRSSAWTIACVTNA